MPDKKVTQLSERVSGVLGTDLLPIVGNTAQTPTNFKVQVKNFLNGLAIDLPQTSSSTLKVTANVTANATTATLAGGELILQANSSVNVTVQDRVGLIIRNRILNGNSNVTGMMWGAHVQLDTGNSNCVAANTYGLVVEHTLANTSWSRLVAPRAYLAFKEQAGTSGNATSYLLDVGAQGNTVSANVTGGNTSVVYSYANSYATCSTRINRSLKINVNGEDVWLMASNVAPNNSISSFLQGPGTTSATGDVRLQGSGWVTALNSALADGQVIRLNSSDNFVEAAGTATNGFRALGSLQVGSAKLSISASGLPTVGNGLTLAGFGWPMIVARNRATAQTAAIASLVTYTPAADATLKVLPNILVTTATTHAFTAVITYTDEGGTSRTLTVGFRMPSDATTITSSIANANGTVPYEGIPVVIRAKGNTAVTVATTGTFTTVVYNAEASIVQIA